MANRIMVFHVGGTLMEFEKMPLNWSEYYPVGLKRLADDFGYNVSREEIS